MGPRFELVACSAPASARSVVRQEPAVHRGETGSPSDRRRGLTLGTRAVGPSRGMQSRSDMATVQERHGDRPRAALLVRTHDRNRVRTQCTRLCGGAAHCRNRRRGGVGADDAQTPASRGASECLASLCCHDRGSSAAALISLRGRVGRVGLVGRWRVGEDEMRTPPASVEQPARLGSSTRRSREYHPCLGSLQEWEYETGAPQPCLHGRTPWRTTHSSGRPGWV